MWNEFLYTHGYGRMNQMPYRSKDVISRLIGSEAAESKRAVASNTFYLRFLMACRQD